MLHSRRQRIGDFMCSIKEFVHIKHLKYEINLISNTFDNSPSHLQKTSCAFITKKNFA
jgi:hypothetical protein